MNSEDHMEHGSVLMTDGTQTICLPKSMRVPDGVTSFDIVKQGRALIIVPSNQSWAEGFEGATVSDDFMVERRELESEQRGAV